MENDLRTAWRFHQENRDADAARCFHHLLEREPGNAAAWHLYGILHHQNGYHARAAELIGRAIDLRPEAAAYHANLAEVQRALGQCEEAIGSCRAALGLQPDYPEAANNLGLALFDLGRYAEAVEQYRVALRMRPGFATAQNNLANALRELGRTDEALEAFRAALALDPEHAMALSNLGQMLILQGEAEEALPHLLKAVQLAPDLPAAHNSLGCAYRALERWDEAGRAFAAALELANLRRERPEVQARVHANLGFTLQLLKWRGKAIQCFRRAAELAPEDVATWRTLGDAYAAVEDFAEALPCYRKVVALRPQWALGHSELGWALQNEGRLREAGACFRRALELQPDLLQGLVNLGHLHEELGDMAQAEQVFRRAQEAYPRAPGPLASLAVLLRGRLPAAEVETLRRRLDDPDLPPGPRSSLLFGLAHVLDARGEHDAAAACLAEANPLALELLRQQGKSYDPDRHCAFVDRIIKGFTPELFARLAGAGDFTRQPVFVFGMPRSGTTLVEQVLASHSRVFGAGELCVPLNAYQSLMDQAEGPEELPARLAALDAVAVQRLCQSYRKELDAILRTARENLGPETASGEHGHAEEQPLLAIAPGTDRIVDKMPDNYLYLGLLALLFPRATFIHVRRDPRDVAVSCWMTNFGSIRWANDPEHLARRIQDHQRLMAHWQAVLPVPVQEVVYERLVEDFEPEARRLVAACGLEWEPACARFHETRRPVRTASVTQVRRPLYRQALARWKHYETALADLFARLPVP